MTAVISAELLAAQADDASGILSLSLDDGRIETSEASDLLEEVALLALLFRKHRRQGGCGVEELTPEIKEAFDALNAAFGPRGVVAKGVVALLRSQIGPALETLCKHKEG